VERSFSLRRFGFAVAAFALVLIVGTIGFKLLEEEGWVAALYRSVVTTSLTGLDTRPRTTGGQIFAIFVLFFGVAIFLYVAGAIVEVIARGVVGGVWAERKRRRMIDEMRDHYIICGYGRVGRRTAAEFREAGVDFVVLDINEDVLELARERGVPYIHGSGTEDEDLHAAGLDRARGLVACSDSDADNLYIAISARSMRPDLLIVARASDEDAARKMRRAGADRVVQPYSAAGQEMAKLVLRPQVAAFLDIVTSAGGPDLRLEEIEVTDASGKAGSSIRKLGVRRETGALIIALRRRDGSFDATPSPDTVLETGDVVIAVGNDAELQALEELFKPRERIAG
jgi:voltage-gated potassium channel